MDRGKAGFHDSHFEPTTKSSTDGKLGTPAQPRRPPICPECGSSRTYKAGLRKTKHGKVQRFKCKDCGLRFSESSRQFQVKVHVTSQLGETADSVVDLGDLKLRNGFSLKHRLNDPSLPIREDVGSQGHSPSISTVGKASNTFHPYNRKRRVGAEEVEAKNLAKVEPQIGKAVAGATAKPLSADVKDKIVEFSFWLHKEGYADDTVRNRTRIIKILVKRGADIFNPEAVKRAIAAQETWGDGMKASAVVTYSSFLEMEGLTWKPPRYRYSQKLPFIPLETELDQLIAGCGKKVSAFLQGLKETGVDPGELWRAEWIDIDVEKRVVRINHPVKGHNPRILPISMEWISMLQRLPRSSERIFPARLDCQSNNFRQQRRRLAVKIGNPRLSRITYTTFRHWKGTTEYHRTKDILHVKRILGHKSIKSTMIYVNLEQALFQITEDKFHSRAAENAMEALSLIDTGFEYVCTTPDNLMLFRKRK
jgi:integrase